MTTPLDPDEADGIIPDHIQTAGALNLWEQTNILRAQEWAFRRRRNDLLEVSFVTELHRRMFDETWTWAGTFRRSDKNIGVPWPTIPTSLRDVLDDAAYWLAHETYPLDETAALFHQRLVGVHPFPNGNGRHGRLMTDLLLRNQGAEPFAWGRGDLSREGGVRAAYLKALRSADGGDIAPLIEFARS